MWQKASQQLQRRKTSSDGTPAFGETPASGNKRPHCPSFRGIQTANGAERDPFHPLSRSNPRIQPEGVVPGRTPSLEKRRKELTEGTFKRLHQSYRLSLSERNRKRPWQSRRRFTSRIPVTESRRSVGQEARSASGQTQRLPDRREACTRGPHLLGSKPGRAQQLVTPLGHSVSALQRLGVPRFSKGREKATVLIAETLDRSFLRQIAITCKAPTPRLGVHPQLIGHLGNRIRRTSTGLPQTGS